MWESKRRLREERDDLRAQIDRMRERAETAEATAKTETTAREIAIRVACEAETARQALARQLAETNAANIRLDGRNRRLTEQLERAHEAANDGALDDIGRRLDRALRACARYRSDADGQTRLIRSQQDLLDRLYGLNDPDVIAGEHWQHRRIDKIGKGLR